MSPCEAALPSAACGPTGSSRPSAAPSPSPPTAASGSLLVGAVVRRVAGGGCDRVHGGAGGPHAHLACRHRLAPARPPRGRRAAGGLGRPEERVATARGGEPLD